RDFHPGADHEDAHLGFVAREVDERYDGKTQLKTEYHLAEYQQCSGLFFTVYEYDNISRDDRDDTGDKPPPPRRDAEIKVPFHHDLTRKRAGDGGALSRGDQRDAKQCRCPFRTQQGRKELVGILNIRDFIHTRFVEGGGGQHKDGGVHEEGGVERDGRID